MKVEFYEVNDIVEMIERAVGIMFARYAYMRQKRKRMGDKDMKKFYEYGLEPYFWYVMNTTLMCAMPDFRN